MNQIFHWFGIYEFLKNPTVTLTLRSSVRAWVLLNMTFNIHLTKYEPNSSIENDLEN